MSCPGKASEHDADHGQPDEGSNGPGVSLEIARQAAIAADPGQGAFDDPALGRHDEFVQFVALDELVTQRPVLAAARAARGPWSVEGLRVVEVRWPDSHRCSDSLRRKMALDAGPFMRLGTRGSSS